MTLAGELYWNFSWPGVIVGLCLLGVITRFSYGWFQRQLSVVESPFVALLLYGVILVNLIRIENGTARIFSRTVKELLFAGFFLAITTRPNGPRWMQIQETAFSDSGFYQCTRKFKTALNSSTATTLIKKIRVALNNSATVTLIKKLLS
jgi:hypothetical protein